MSNSVAPIIVTSVSTLVGVALTAVLADVRERRRISTEEHRSARADAQEQFRWLRDERRRLYAAIIALVERGIELYGTLLDDMLRDNFTRLENPQAVQASLLAEIRDCGREVSKSSRQIRLIGSPSALLATQSANDGIDDLVSLIEHMATAPPSVEADAFPRTAEVYLQLTTAIEDLTDAAREDLGTV